MLFALFTIIFIAGAVWYYVNESVFYPKKVELTKQLIADNNFDEALATANALPDKVKPFPEIQYIFYRIYFHQTQYFMAVYHLNEILKNGQYTDEITEVSTRLDLAEVHELMGKRKTSLNEYYKIVSELDPDNLTANRKAGIILYELRNYGAALSYLEKAQSISPGDVTVEHYLAEIYYINERYHEARDLLANLVEGRPDANPDMALTYLKCLLKLEKYDKILEKNQIRTNNKDQRSTLGLISGISNYHIGNTKEAESLISEALIHFSETYNPLTLEARYLYSKILFNNGQIREAQRQLQMIHNSGKEDQSIAEELDILNQITQGKTLMQGYSLPMESFIHKILSKGISHSGFMISDFKIFSKRRAAISAHKTAATGRSLFIGLLIDFSLEGPPASFIKQAMGYFTKENVSNIYVLTCALPPGSGKEVLASSSIPIELFGPEQIEKVLTGKQVIE